jgi:hypothetical protein
MSRTRRIHTTAVGTLKFLRRMTMLITVTITIAIQIAVDAMYQASA